MSWEEIAVEFAQVEIDTSDPEDATQKRVQEVAYRLRSLKIDDTYPVKRTSLIQWLAEICVNNNLVIVPMEEAE